MMKKYIMTILICCIVICMPSIVWAAGTEMNTGDVLSPVKSIEEQLNGLSEEQRENALKKINEENNVGQVSLYSTSWTYLDDFVMYSQEEDYYCVVACTKSAMQYLTGNSASQKEIADELNVVDNVGTSIGEAQEYLNDNQTKNVYIRKASTETIDTMKANFNSALTIYDAPPLFSAYMLEEKGWDYFNTGHCMCITGVRSDKVFFQVGDPYIRYEIPDSPMTFPKAASVIHYAIQMRGNGYIY